jgi:hypothetical protein
VLTDVLRMPWGVELYGLVGICSCGAGEGGINPVGAAIASAIDDALGFPGAVTRLPVTPQRLREILKRVKL